MIVDSEKTGNIFEFPAPFSMAFFLVGMFMSLYVIYGFDTASTLAEETRNPRAGGAEGRAGVRDRGVHHRRDLPVGRADRGAEHGRRGGGILRTAGRHRERHDEGRFDALPAGRLGRDLRLLHVDPDLDDPARRSAWLATISCRSRRRWRRSTHGSTRRSARASSSVCSRRSRSSSSRAPTVIAVGATASIYLSYLLGNLAVMRARTRGGRRRRRRSRSERGARS